MKRFDSLINALSRVELSDRACNQYARGDRANAIRRRNLELYLEEIRSPRMILIGEAPSYRGGRLTGIPFTSEQIMLRGVDGRVLGAERGYRKATAGDKRSTEASATMVWATIACIDPLPLLWNAFPFHPFAAGNPSSESHPDRRRAAHRRDFHPAVAGALPDRMRRGDRKSGRRLAKGSSR